MITKWVGLKKIKMSLRGWFPYFCRQAPYSSHVMRKPVLPYANNKGADQPAHPCSLISAFVIYCLDGIISLVSISKISSLLLVSVAEQAGLSLTWSETLKTGFLVTRLIHNRIVILFFGKLTKRVPAVYEQEWNTSTYSPYKCASQVNSKTSPIGLKAQLWSLTLYEGLFCRNYPP